MGGTLKYMAVNKSVNQQSIIANHESMTEERPVQKKKKKRITISEK